MKLKFLFAILSTQLLLAQHRTCGTSESMRIMMTNPVFKQQYLDQQRLFNIELDRINHESVANRSVQTVRIPVAVHFPSVSASASASLKTCLRNLAQNQINILNADYNAINTDISTWFNNDVNFYPGVSVGNLGVNFELATQNHPAGTGIPNGTVAVTFGTDFLNANISCGACNSDTTWSGYVNIVVKNINGGILGYSPFLGVSPGTGYTVVINTFCFGSGNGCTGYIPESPYDLGRTLTHELGHYFDLEHTFNGCGENDCSFYDGTSGMGDGCCDTPPLDLENYGCPVAGNVSSCDGGSALTMNYMDYVDDACMYMFTQGQENRIRAHYNTISSQIRANVLANEAFLESKFSLYPNPAKGSFTIDFKEATAYSVQVFDATGKVVFENDYDSVTSLQQIINLNTTAKGVYFVNIKTDNGLVTKKLIIE